jgi:hypothetical protein
MSESVMGERFDAVTCAECGRQPRPGELWRLYFADIGEVVIYCPACAEREFGDRGTREQA